jgi:peptide/nickel transport system permease protein
MRGFADGLRQIARKPLTFAGLLVVSGYMLLAIVGPLVAPYDYRTSHRDPNDCTVTASGREICAKLENAPPSSQHPLGVDKNGRDVLSRLLWGARQTIGLPAIATMGAVALGTTIGLIAGYAAGWLDDLISRAVDILLAIPAMILALVMLTTLVPLLESTGSSFLIGLGPTNIAIVLVVILLYTPIVVRVVRSAALRLRSTGYVEAARLRGERVVYILFREIAPGVLPTLAVEAALRFSYAIFLVASLGFLGLGVQPPSSEWGRMVLDAYKDNAILNAPWAIWSPALAIATLIIAVNLLSDGLRKILRYEQ